jgi:hypothetical protein
MKLRTIPDNVEAAIKHTCDILGLAREGVVGHHKASDTYRVPVAKGPFHGSIEVYLNSADAVSTVSVSINWEHP